MLSPQLFTLAFAMAPSLVSAALFPRDSLVKVIDPKGFKKAMKTNETSIVAFVAPWCVHCQKMVPEYSKAALGLYPLVPAYAVDCDAEKNKRLCAEQGVQGFPTVKLFPRGGAAPPLLYNSERTASGLWYFATRGIPQTYTKIRDDQDISPWVEKHKSKHRVLLLRKDKKTPLLWQILSNKYQGRLEFGVRRDPKGKSSVALGLEAGEKRESKVILYPAGSSNFVRYEGIQKLDSFSRFLDSVLDGTADLSTIIDEAKSEEFVMDEAELEIEREQEKQRIALLHGGYSNLIDFEKAMKDGAGAGYHDSHGYVGAMGGIPEHLKKSSAASVTSTSSTSTGTTSTAADTATPLPAEKDDEAAKKPVDAPETMTAPEPVVAEEEEILEQVILEATKERDPEGCPFKENAQSQVSNDGVPGSCPTRPAKRRSEDEL
jgi:protein disulfide-isomerase A6